MRKIKRGILIFLTAVFCVAGSLMMFGERTSSANRSETEENTLTLDIAPESVYRIDLYWKYQTLSVSLEDNAEAVNEAVKLLNGEYALFEVLSRDRTGMANHVSLYDESGILLAEYGIFFSDDDKMSIANSDERLIYMYRKTGEEDDEYLRSLIELIENKEADSSS